MATEDGKTVTFVVLLDMLTLTPPAGAAAGRVMLKGVTWPIPTVTLEGTMMPPTICTVMLAVVFAMLGREAALMVAEPSATPVTGTVVLVALAAKVTVAGTVATLVLLELRLIVRPPAGAGADRFRVRFCVVVPIIVAIAGEKLMVAVTSTGWLADV
jgi:hypothetical protein